MTNCSIFPLITGDEVENSTGLSPNNQKQSGTIRRYFLDGSTMPMTLETHLRSPGALCASCDCLWGRPNPPCFSFTLSHWKKPNELSVRWGFPSSSDSKKKKKKKKKSLCNAGDQGSILGQEDSLEKGMATHSSILAWRIPWTEEPGELQSIGSQRVRHD